MTEEIVYLDALERISLPYSDESVIKEIEKRVSKINANMIEMWFCNYKENHVTVMVCISNKQMVHEMLFPVQSECIYLHDIDEEEENYKAHLKEIQREKNLIKYHFKELKVSSNFR